MSNKSGARCIVKQGELPACPAKRLCYGVLADTLRGIFNPYLTDYQRAPREADLQWLFDDAYGKRVDRLGGCSFEFCCLSLDINDITFRKVIKHLLTNKKDRDKYSISIINNIYNYNNIYFNIYNNTNK